MQPTFSIVHASARPNGWLASHDAWMANAVAPEAVEYVLAYDTRWEFPADYTYHGVRAIQSTGRKCSVDAWNGVVFSAKGKVILINSDDMFPCAEWDRQLLAAIPDLDGEFVVETTSNIPADDSRIMVFQILTRRRLEKVGYLFWPDYESMSADMEFSDHARRDGIVIDARHIIIEHRHYTFGRAPVDSAYLWQNRPEAYRLGDAVYARRCAEGFPGLV